jgi:serine/threonine protein kinase
MLKGNSGCSLELLDQDSKVVRKVSPSDNYNIRLMSQMTLQMNFYDDTILTPRVIGEGFQDKCFYFDMEYVNGTTLIDWIRDAELNSLSLTIEKILNQVVHNPIVGKVDINSIIQDKLSEILLKTSNIRFHKLINKNSIFLTSFNWKNYPSTKCHGDLTLENIIITNDHVLYYIDFLDSIIDSWLFDIAKLMQDTLLKWSIRNYNQTSEDYLIRLQNINEFIINFVKLNYGIEYIEMVYRLILLNIFRIMPYCKDSTTEKWIFESINQINDLIGV